MDVEGAVTNSPPAAATPEAPAETQAPEADAPGPDAPMAGQGQEDAVASSPKHHEAQHPGDEPPLHAEGTAVEDQQLGIPMATDVHADVPTSTDMQADVPLTTDVQIDIPMASDVDYDLRHDDASVPVSEEHHVTQEGDHEQQRKESETPESDAPGAGDAADQAPADAMLVESNGGLALRDSTGAGENIGDHGMDAEAPAVGPATQQGASEEHKEDGGAVQVREVL